ncbi:DUF7507 domain-containing protein, partial [Sphingomonas rosea]|uniref:DUF7507 domain-containing protein n=1 Tax=Sphingomonas rosea TaxID=335605 RepID=UPI0031D66BAC
SSPLVYNPDFSVVKSVASITGGTYDAGTKLWTADSAGDKVNYTIAVQNLGNITLTGFTYSDPNADGGTITYVSGDTDGDNALDVGETWTFSAVHTVTQGELNSKGTNDAGALDTDGDTDNKVTVDFAETSEKSASTVSLLSYAPGIDLVKYVSVTGKDGSYVDANTAALGPQNVNIGAPVFFQVTVENKGIIDLTNVKITDLNTSNGGNVSVTLFENKTLLAGAILAGDTDSDGILDVGEKWTITYSQPFDSGQHVNTATVTTAENVTDSDAAYYYSIVNTGPGVRTPGFWGSPNGLEFWDGVANNESKGGMTGFAKGELTYLVDSNNDGVLDSKGLLLGDLDKDGITDLGENTFYVSLSDAKALINASSKLENSDGAVKIGRDAVATWLNYLAGNSLGTDSDAKSPLTYLNDGIDFLQAWAGKAGPVGGGGEVFDAWDSNHKAVKTNSSAWTGAGEGGNYSGDAIHNALDYYNNFGQTSYGGFKYADDGDDGGFLKALAASQSTLHII